MALTDRHYLKSSRLFEVIVPHRQKVNVTRPVAILPTFVTCGMYIYYLTNSNQVGKMARIEASCKGNRHESCVLVMCKFVTFGRP